MKSPRSRSALANFSIALLGLCSACSATSRPTDATIDDAVIDVSAAVDHHRPDQTATADAAPDALPADGKIVDAAIDSAVIDAAIDSAVIDAAIDSAVIDAAIDSAVIDAAIDSAGGDTAVDSIVVDAAGADGATADGGATGPQVSTLAGGASSGSTDGPGSTARFDNPANVVHSASGLYVADYNNGTLRKITINGTVTTLTQQQNFSAPFALALTPNGTLYASTDGNDLGQETYGQTGTLWQIDTITGLATVVLRDIGNPRGIAAISDDKLLIVDPSHHTLRILTISTKSMATIAGSYDQAGDIDATGAAARFNTPYDVVIDSQGNFYVADQGNHKLRKVTPGGVVSTFAGAGSAATKDGSGVTAQFDQPQGLAIDKNDTIYLSELAGHVLRRITSAAVVTTIAGDGTAGFADGDRSTARFFGLEGIDVSIDGATLFVADGNRGGSDPYHRIRQIILP
ncbi:MAG: SMP-30/gluconolactonase/LRE family protein [Deltaproteobacteria bacterium]|nr:SMP-30/gluconolactonase/LRE family protein [Deltaproteobacteria bacterium]